MSVLGCPIRFNHMTMENDPVEIVDFPIKNSDFPVRYVSLPEGNHCLTAFCMFTRC